MAAPPSSTFNSPTPPPPASDDDESPRRGSSAARGMAAAIRLAKAALLSATTHTDGTWHVKGLLLLLPPHTQHAPFRVPNRNHRRHAARSDGSGPMHDARCLDVPCLDSHGLGALL